MWLYDSTRVTRFPPWKCTRKIFEEILELAYKAVEKAKEEVKVTTNIRYLNKKGLCEYFTCAPRVVEQWQREGLKSFLKGKEIMFDINDVHDFLEKKKF